MTGCGAGWAQDEGILSAGRVRDLLTVSWKPGISATVTKPQRPAHGQLAYTPSHLFREVTPPRLRRLLYSSFYNWLPQRHTQWGLHWEPHSRVVRSVTFGGHHLPGKSLPLGLGGRAWQLPAQPFPGPLGRPASGRSRRRGGHQQPGKRSRAPVPWAPRLSPPTSGAPGEAGRVWTPQSHRCEFKSWLCYH